MSKFIGALVCLCMFTLGCGDSPPRFRLPTSASGGSSAPAPAPRPPLPSVDFDEITLGQTVTRVVPSSPPPCVGWPEWPCQYFRFTAPRDGRVTVELRYKPETQPSGRFGAQTVDISVLDSVGIEVWAHFGGPDSTRAALEVKEGEVYQITLWYTYPRLEYELQTTLN